MKPPAPAKKTTKPVKTTKSAKVVQKTVSKKADKPKIPPVVELPIEPERRFWWATWLGASVVALAGTAALAYHQLQMSHIEERLFQFINNWPSSLRPEFLVGSIAPESLWIAVAVVLVVFFLKLYRLAWQLSVGIVSGSALTLALKYIIARPRPEDMLAVVHTRVHETSYGFPSAHVMIITVIVLTLFPYLPKGWRWAVMVLIPIMALSRVYLGVHAPLDVVGGFVVGLLCVSFFRALPRKLREPLQLD